MPEQPRLPHTDTTGRSHEEYCARKHALRRPVAGWQPSPCAHFYRAGTLALHHNGPTARRRCAAYAVESADSKAKGAVYLSDIIAFEVGRWELVPRFPDAHQ